VVLKVRISPRARRDSLEGEREGALLVRVTAAPVDGAANAALVRLIGKAVGIPPSAVRIMQGMTGRRKLLLLVGADVSHVRAALESPDEEEEP
jgi:uncharacterized protein YggU (UPF0235/DUF167 family)